jgi:transcriptional regulator with XRE-family HTH domain
LSLATVAARVGCSKGYLSSVENGKVRPPRDAWIRRLAAILKIGSVELLRMAYRERAPRALRRAFDRPPVPASPPHDEETLRAGIPLLNSPARRYPRTLDADGLPERLVTGCIVIPGLRPDDCFALFAREPVEPGPQNGGLNSRDAVIFSRSVRAMDGDLVFALLRKGRRRLGLLRRLAWVDEDSFLLSAGPRASRIRICHRREAVRLFPAVGRVAFFPRSASGRIGRKERLQ